MKYNKSKQSKKYKYKGGALLTNKKTKTNKKGGLGGLKNIMKSKADTLMNDKNLSANMFKDVAGNMTNLNAGELLDGKQTPNMVKGILDKKTNNNDNNNDNSPKKSRIQKMIESKKDSLLKEAAASPADMFKDALGMSSNNNNDDPAKKKSDEKLKDKLMKLQKKAEIFATKSPAEHLLDVFYNFSYNIKSIYTYFIMSMINLPENTLENIIPEEGGCHLIFSDKSTCKKKIKCFFKKCSITDDQTGYMLNYKDEQEEKSMKVQKGGIADHLDKYGNYKNVSCKPNPDPNYAIKAPLSFKPLIMGTGKANKKEMMKYIKNLNVNLLNRINKFNFIGGSNVGNASNEEVGTEQTFIMKRVVEEHLTLEDTYKFLWLLKMMEIVYNDIDKDVEHVMENQKKEEHKLFTNKEEVIHIPFPFQHALLDTAPERIECLMAHLLDETGDDFEHNPTLKTCLPCKKCTLMGQSSKVISELYEELMSGVKKTFKQIILSLFDVFMNAMNVTSLTSKQLAILITMNYKINDRDINIHDLNDIIGDNMMYRDALLMIPEMKLSDDIDVKNNEIFVANRYVYAYFKSAEMEKVLLSVLYKKLYLDVSSIKYQNKRLGIMKENIKKLLRLTGKYITIELKEKRKMGSVIRKINKNLGKEQLEYFREPKLSSTTSTLQDMLRNNKLSKINRNHYNKYMQAYKDIVTNNLEGSNSENIKLLSGLL